MARKTYKEKAIIGIRKTLQEYELKKIPRISLQKMSFGVCLSIENTEIMERADLDDYVKGKIIGQIRSLVDLFNLTNEDFK